MTRSSRPASIHFTILYLSHKFQIPSTKASPKFLASLFYFPPAKVPPVPKVFIISLHKVSDQCKDSLNKVSGQFHDSLNKDSLKFRTFLILPTKALASTPLFVFYLLLSFSNSFTNILGDLANCSLFLSSKFPSFSLSHQFHHFYSHISS